ncbi:MAG: hypothetical protein DME32_02175 [Verrucomicrobia bacterium]|nr:MAG: hypothetical protein DME32_02175 [Verrucomicrobiota bacterium]
MRRLLWLDIAKAIAISWVVYFHFFNTVFQHTRFPVEDWSTLAAGTVTVIRMAWLKISSIGFHAVGVFIILSGWALMESTARRAESSSLKWGSWFGARFLRLYPMYWVAHLVYLVSPFVARLEPVDSRIILSLLGLRFIDITMNFMYLNAAWWYFSMLIQFYVMFPLLFWAAQRFGPLAFLLMACALGFFVRYLLLVVYPQHGFWVLGGFAVYLQDSSCIQPRCGCITMELLTSLSISQLARVACSKLSASLELSGDLAVWPKYSA